MANKKKIHPRITETTRDILEKIGKKPSNALEEYACFKATNKESVMIEEKMLKEKEQELLEDKAKIEERLEKVQDELANIKKLKLSFNPVKSAEFEETVLIVKQMLELAKSQLNSGKWGLQKPSIDDVGRVCKQRNMPIEAVLDNIPKSLLKYLDEYPL